MDTFLLSILLILLAKTTHYLITLATHTPPKPNKPPSPPGPPPLPLLGNLLHLGSEPAHGPIMTLKLGSITTIIISSSTLAKHVLILNAHRFSAPFPIDAVYAHHHHRLSVGWLPATSPTWYSLRRLFGVVFATSRLEGSAGLRQDEVARLVDRVRECCRNGRAVDVGREAVATLFKIMVYSVFSRGVRSLCSVGEIEELILAIIQEVGEPNLADSFPVLHSVDPQGIRRRLTSLCGRLFEVFNKIIDARLITRTTMKTRTSSEDALDVILDAMEEQENITRDIVLHMLMDIIGSGMDSSSKVIEWAMSELIQHPQTLKRAQQELDKIVGKSQLVNDSHINNLPFLQATLKETFRLHPPVPFLPPRRTKEELELHGYTIPKGSRVVVNLWAFGRDPNDWSNPELFEPERFLDTKDNVDAKRGRRLEMIPFSVGRRICPGMGLASHTVMLMLASVIQCFDWKVEEEVDMRADFRVTLKKVIPLRVVPIERV